MYLCRLKCPKEHHKVMKKEKRDNYTFLTHAPVHHVIFTMAIPTIISMLSTSMYNLADTYFVGSINTQSVAAVGVSFAAMAVIQAIGFFFGHGAGNYVSRQLGAKHTEDGNNGLCAEFSYRSPHSHSGSFFPHTALSSDGFYAHHSSLYRALSGHYPAGCSLYDHLAYAA